MTYVLEATRATQGSRDDDYAWTVDGELVFVPFIDCCDERCGCKRGFAGMTSHRAATTAQVVDRSDLGPGTVIGRSGTSLMVRSPGTDGARGETAGADPGRGRRDELRLELWNDLRRRQQQRMADADSSADDSAGLPRGLPSLDRSSRGRRRGRRGDRRGGAPRR